MIGEVSLTTYDFACYVRATTCIVPTHLTVTMPITGNYRVRWTYRYHSNVDCKDRGADLHHLPSGVPLTLCRAKERER
jgi:hypothetical protein